MSWINDQKVLFLGIVVDLTNSSASRVLKALTDTAKA